MEGAASMGIPMNDSQADQLATHCEMLLAWNRKMNLTAIIDPYEVAVKHVLDSIAPAGLIPEETSVLDMGSGRRFSGDSPENSQAFPGHDSGGLIGEEGQFFKTCDPDFEAGKG